MRANRTRRFYVFPAVLITVGILIGVVRFGETLFPIEQPRSPITPREAQDFWNEIKFGLSEDVQRILDSGLVDIEQHRDYANSYCANPLSIQKMGEGHCGCQSLLGFAVLWGHREIAEQLIRAGADPNGAELDEILHPPPLFWAAVGGHMDMVTFLIENGADPLSRRSGHSLMEWYERSSFVEQAKYAIFVLETAQWPPHGLPPGWTPFFVEGLWFFAPSHAHGGEFEYGSTMPRLFTLCYGDSFHIRVDYEFRDYGILFEDTETIQGEPTTIHGIDGNRCEQQAFDEKHGWHDVLILELFPSEERRTIRNMMVPSTIRLTAECYTKSALETADMILDSIRFAW